MNATECDTGEGDAETPDMREDDNRSSGSCRIIVQRFTPSLQRL